MNSNFQSLLDKYAQEWERTVNSSNLQEVENTYMAADEAREETLTWIFENIEEDESKAEYFKKFGEFENGLLDRVGDVPVFDASFDVYESFDEYETYYQRYGCETPEFIVSWDTSNVLWTDGFTVDYIKRPDILMSGDD